MECIKILGQGKQGIVFLTLNNKVIKIQSSKDKKISIGDYFGINIAPKLQPYFMIIYNIKFIEKKSLDKIICKDKSSINLKIQDKNKFLFTTNVHRYYKISVMEYTGKPLGINEWTNKNCLKCFNDLLKPILKMNSLGYFHNDLHFKNITLHNNIFKIIDYDIMSRNKSTNDINSLLTFLTPSISLIWWRPKYYDFYRSDNYNSETIYKKLKLYYDGPGKFNNKKYMFPYMGLYHPKLFFNILLYNKNNGGTIPRDIGRKLFNANKIMSIYYLVRTTFNPKTDSFINLYKNIIKLL
tara:strand:+ start:303 stop:1190 length:888 start_codon:yes stop_codon:yes gene_type:complete